MLEFDRRDTRIVADNRPLDASDNLSVTWLAYCRTPTDGRALVSTERTSMGPVIKRCRPLKQRSSPVAGSLPAPSVPPHLAHLAQGLAGALDAVERRQFRQLIDGWS